MDADLFDDLSSIHSISLEGRGIVTRIGFNFTIYHFTARFVVWDFFIDKEPEQRWGVIFEYKRLCLNNGLIRIKKRSCQCGTSF